MVINIHYVEKYGKTADIFFTEVTKFLLTTEFHYDSSTLGGTMQYGWIVVLSTCSPTLNIGN